MLLAKHMACLGATCDTFSSDAEPQFLVKFHNEHLHSSALADEREAVSINVSSGSPPHAWKVLWWWDPPRSPTMRAALGVHLGFAHSEEGVAQGARSKGEDLRKTQLQVWACVSMFPCIICCCCLICLALKAKLSGFKFNPNRPELMPLNYAYDVVNQHPIRKSFKY